MGRIWFTADEHYGHKNIIKLANRPFKDLHEMHKVLTENFNSVVSKDDITFHLGDFAFSNKKKGAGYMWSLNGEHVVLKGNHDKWLGSHAPLMLIRKFEGQWMTLCHYPLRTWDKRNRGGWMLHGHTHGNLPPLPLQWDVGVDNNNFYPISLEELRERLNESEEDRGISTDNF